MRLFTAGAAPVLLGGAEAAALMGLASSQDVAPASAATAAVASGDQGVMNTDP